MGLHEVAQSRTMTGDSSLQDNWPTDEPDRGSVTAEFAVLLPSVVALIALVLSVGVYGARTVTAQEAARTAARSVARGDSWETAKSAARKIVGREAEVGISKSATGAEISVVAPAPGVLGTWGGLEVSARAHALLPEEAGG